jgi:hypothetical protein
LACAFRGVYAFERCMLLPLSYSMRCCAFYHMLTHCPASTACVWAWFSSYVRTQRSMITEICASFVHTEFWFICWFLCTSFARTRFSSTPCPSAFTLQLVWFSPAYQCMFLLPANWFCKHDFARIQSESFAVHITGVQFHSLCLIAPLHHVHAPIQRYVYVHIYVSAHGYLLTRTRMHRERHTGVQCHSLSPSTRRHPWISHHLL